MNEAYKLFSQMQINYKRYRKGGPDAMIYYKKMIAACVSLMELGVVNPFDPSKLKRGQKIMGVTNNESGAAHV